MNKEFRAALLLLLAAFIWGFAMAAQREASRYLSPLCFNASRFTLGALALLPLMLRENKKTKAPLTGRQTLPGALIGVVLFLATLMQQAAVGEAGAGKAGFLTALYVVLVPVCGMFLGKRPHPAIWAALALALPALYLLCVPAGAAFALSPWDGLLLAGAGLWTAQILLTDHFASRIPPLKLCTVEFSVCAALNWICALLFESVSLSGLLAATVPILYCGILSTGVAYFLQAIGQRDCRPALAALILSLEAVFCVIAGALLLGETMDARGYGGCALMLLAVLLAQAGFMQPHAKEKNHV